MAEGHHHPLMQCRGPLKRGHQSLPQATGFYTAWTHSVPLILQWTKIWLFIYQNI